MFKKNNDVEISANSFDVKDREKYEYLDPVWDVLENTPEKGITAEELWDCTDLDPVKGNQLLKELQNEFMSKFLEKKNMMALIMNNSLVARTWVFDKIMLLVTRLDTSSGVDLPDNLVMNNWKKEWRKQRGV